MDHNKIFEAKYVQKPPLFPPGTDSCKRFYFTNFKGFDTVLIKLIEKGDTAKYIRVYFSFVIDRNGIPYDSHFEKIASTQYASSDGARTIKYFSENKIYFQQLIRQMISRMSFWKPALQNGAPVDCRVDDYLQFWVGLTLPKN